MDIEIQFQEIAYWNYVENIASVKDWIKTYTTILTLNQQWFNHKLIVALGYNIIQQH